MNSPNDSDNDDDSRNTDSIRSRMWHRDDRPESAEHNNDNEPTSSITSTDTDGIQTNETPDTVSQSPSPPRQNTERPSMSDDRTPPTFVPRLRLENIRSIGTQGTERLPPESAFRAFSAAMTTNSPHRGVRTPDDAASPPIPSHAPTPTSGVQPVARHTQVQFQNALQRHGLDDIAIMQTAQQALSQQTSRSPRATPSGSRDSDTTNEELAARLAAVRERARLESRQLERRAAELTAEIAFERGRIAAQSAEAARRRERAEMEALLEEDGIILEWDSDSTTSPHQTRNDTPHPQETPSPQHFTTPSPRNFTTPSPLTSRHPPIVNRGRRGSTVDSDEIVGTSLFNTDVPPIPPSIPNINDNTSDVPFLGIPAPPAVASSAIGVINVDDTGMIMPAEEDEYEEAPITPINTPPRGINRPSPMHSPTGTRANIMPPINNNTFIGFYGKIFENNTTEDYIRINHIENETPIATHLNLSLIHI